jgi:hypothetical protein
MRRKKAGNLEKYHIVEKSDESESPLQGQKKMPLATSSQGACKVVASHLYIRRK